MSESGPHRVVVLALDNVIAFELGLPHRFFAETHIARARPQHGGALPLYDVALCTEDDGPVRTSAGYLVTPTHGNDVIGSADTIVIPGVFPSDIIDTGQISASLAALLATAQTGVRWVSICTGAFVLAAAGLLAGKKATTHWIHSATFAAHFPQIDLDPDVLFVDNGDVLTSAGNAAGIDLLLHVLRRDHGTELANRVARGCVVAPWREGGQAQFIHRPVPDVDGGTAAAREWVLDRIAEPITLAHMAAVVGMSVRTFTRRFREETGETTGSWLARCRVERARLLLETTDYPVDQVAREAGFGTATSMRHHLQVTVGRAPLAYRRTFRAAGL